MKRILLALLVMFGLQTQAQINYCDSMIVNGPQNQPIFEVVGVNTFIDYWVTTSNDGVLFQEDSMSTYHMVYNFGTPAYDTLTTCITYGMGTTTTCCVNWIWDANMWLKMSMQQQPYFCCDSITYWTDQSQGFNIGLDTTGMVHNPDSLEVWWAVCTNGMCYAGDGMYDYFPQVTTLDTLKVSYDVYLYENGIAEVCSREEWLIYDGTNWVLLNMLPTGIEELMKNEGVNNVIYDLMGREVTKLNKGVMYIRNQKKFIILR
tara:strand:+ start:16 stop:798 length:783 start_codon:yes stop_codon:yes gene_type:complete